MVEKEKITEVVLGCIADFNVLNGTSIIADINTVLFGMGSELDSIDFVSLIVAIEDKICYEYGVVISLTSEKAMSKKNSPFRTIGTLVDYISELV